MPECIYRPRRLAYPGRCHEHSASALPGGCVAFFFRIPISTFLRIVHTLFLLATSCLSDNSVLIIFLSDTSRVTAPASPRLNPSLDSPLSRREKGCSCDMICDRMRCHVLLLLPSRIAMPER
jgi:hypothetical protein